MRLVAVSGCRKFMGAKEETYVHMCEGLAERGHSVYALTPPKTQMLATLKSSRVGVLAFKQMVHLGKVARKVGKKGKSLGYFKMRKLRRILKRANPDFVLVADTDYWELLKQVCGDKYKLVATPRTEPTHRFAGAEMLVAQTGTGRARMSASLEVPGGVWVVPDSIRVVPQEDYKDLAEGETPVVGSLGRFDRDRGFEDLIDAAGLLKERKVRFRMVLAGTGPSYKDCRKRARSLGLKVGPGREVEFRGWIPGRADFYGGLDVFCLPSRREAFGYPVFEAWMYGAPVVTTDAEGPGELVRHGQDGLVTARGSPEDLASALEYLLGTSTARRSLSLEGRRRLDEEFGVESVSELWEAALEGFLTRRKPEEMRLTGVSTYRAGGGAPAVSAGGHHEEASAEEPPA